MICRYCDAELTVETNFGDPMVRQRDIKSFLLGADGSTMCRTKSGAETLHMPVLLPREDPVTTAPPTRETTILALSSIDPAPDNPRGAFELTPEFVKSIKDHGILVSITVVPRGDRFEVVFGHRRYHGAVDAGLLEAPVEIRHDWATDELELKSARVVEQIHREQWSDLALARAFKQLEELGLSQRKIADRTHFNQSTVSRHLDLLKLPEPAQLWLTQGEVTQEEALFIGKLPDDELESLLGFEDADGRRAELDALEFAHELERAREKKIEELRTGGVAILEEDDDQKSAKPVSAMPWVNVAKHRKGECRAVVVEMPHYRDQAPKLTEWCTAPKSHPRPVRHEDGATRKSAAGKALGELLEQLEAATARRHEFLAGIVPDPLEVLTELIVEEFGLDKDTHLLNALGVESIGEAITDLEGAIKVLWLDDMLKREQPELTWRDAFAAPRSVDTFVLTGVRARAAVEILDELRELGYEPSPIERYRAGEIAQLETLPLEEPGEPDDTITIEVRLVRGYHVAVCSTCGAVAKGSKNEEASRLKGVDHLWEIHGIGSVTPIDGGAASN